MQVLKVLKGTHSVTASGFFKINLLYLVDNLQVNYTMFPLLFPVCMLARHVVMVCKYVHCGGLCGCDSNSHPVFGNHLGELHFFKCAYSFFFSKMFCDVIPLKKNVNQNLFKYSFLNRQVDTLRLCCKNHEVHAV